MHYVRFPRSLISAISLVAFVLPGIAEAGSYRYSFTLSIRGSSGGDDSGLEIDEIATHSGLGVAHVLAGQVSLVPDPFSAPIPVEGGFSGTLVDVAGVFSTGVETSFECGALLWDEACIGGGGFGGEMALSGLHYDDISLSRWGVGGETQITSSGTPVARHQAEAWTTGRASAWFYLFLIDPTPFRMTETGTFRGLPSTYGGSGDPGFTLVTPMVVHSYSDPQTTARGIAKLEVRFVPEPAPLVLLSFGVLGLARMARRRLRAKAAAQHSSATAAASGSRPRGFRA